MNQLDYAEMGILKRRHGILVTRQDGKHAWVTYADGRRDKLRIDALRLFANRPWTERLREFIAGCAI